MPAAIDPKLKAQIKRAYLHSQKTAAELAKTFGVSDRSVQGWAKAEHWDAEREANKVIELDTTRQPRENPRSVRRGNPTAMSSIEIANDTIADLYGDLGNAVGKDKASIANSLKAWIEYREKLQPPTASDLVKRAIELGYSPETFMQALRDEWQRQKA